MRRSTARGIVVPLLVVDAILLVIGVVFIALVSESARELVIEIFVRLVAVPFLTIGALVVTRDPANRIGWIFLGIATCFTFNDSVFAYARYAVEQDSVGRDLAVWLSAWVWLPGLGGVGALVLLFPNGHAVSRRWAWLGWTGTIGMVVASFCNAFWLRPIDGLNGFVNPLGVDGTAGRVVEAGIAVGSTLLFFSMLLSGVSLLVRLKRSRGDERQQIKWFTFAAALLAFSIFGTAATFREGTAVTTVDLFFQTLTIVAASFVAIAAGLAVLKYRLYEIDVIINRTIVYATLTAVLGGFYVGLVIAFQAVLDSFTQESDLAVVASTLAVAGLFRPARTRVQDFIDRRFYRQKFDAEQTVAEFSSQLRDEVDLGSVTAQLVDAVRDTMQPAHVSLWLREGEAR